MVVWLRKLTQKSVKDSMQKDNINTFVAMCSVFLVRQVTFKITTYPPTKPINTKLVWDSGSFIERIHVVFYRLLHMGHMICPYDMGHIKWAFLYGGVFCVKSHYNSKVGNMVDTYKMCLNFAETGELEYISKGQIFWTWRLISDENEFLFDADIIQQMCTKLGQRFRQWIGESDQ